MKPLGILFKPDMHSAIREDRKTQTRRMMKPQPPAWVTEMGYTAFTPDGCISGRGWYPGDDLIAAGPGEKFFKSRYRVGDLLYVKEGLRAACNFDKEGGWIYRLDNTPVVVPKENWTASIVWAHHKSSEYCSPLHMPKWAARTWLEVTGVRAERLQDISEADAIAEGVAPLFTAQERASRPELDVDGYRNYLWHGWVGKTITQKQADAWPHQYSSYDTARGSYSSLWESINGPGSWAANPWVWVYEFRRIER